MESFRIFTKVSPPNAQKLNSVMPGRDYGLIA